MSDSRTTTLTYGRKINLEDPDISSFSNEELISCLKNITRFNGEFGPDCNVYNHTMNMIAQCGGNSKLEIACLIHDMPEIFLGDINFNVKNLIGRDHLIFWIRAEESITNQLLDRYSLTKKEFEELHSQVSELDMISLYQEAYFFGGQSTMQDMLDIDGFPIKDIYYESSFLESLVKEGANVKATRCQKKNELENSESS